MPARTRPCGHTSLEASALKQASGERGLMVTAHLPIAASADASASRAHRPRAAWSSHVRRDFKRLAHHALRRDRSSVSDARGPTSFSSSARAHPRGGVARGDRRGSRARHALARGGRDVREPSRTGVRLMNVLARAPERGETDLVATAGEDAVTTVVPSRERRARARVAGPRRARPRPNAPRRTRATSRAACEAARANARVDMAPVSRGVDRVVHEHIIHVRRGNVDNVGIKLRICTVDPGTQNWLPTPSGSGARDALSQHQHQLAHFSTGTALFEEDLPRDPQLPSTPTRRRARWTRARSRFPRTHR